MRQFAADPTRFRNRVESDGSSTRRTCQPGIFVADQTRSAAQWNTSLALLQHSAADAHTSRKIRTAQLVFPAAGGQSEFGKVTAGNSRLGWGVMGTLSERLADAVASDSNSADRLFDAHWPSHGALQSIHTNLSSNLINRESLTVSHAIGAEEFRDSATQATSL